MTEFSCLISEIQKTSARTAITNNDSNLHRNVNKYKSTYTVHTIKFLAQVFLKTNCTVIMKWLFYCDNIMNTFTTLQYILLWCLKSPLYVGIKQRTSNETAEGTNNFLIMNHTFER